MPSAVIVALIAFFGAIVGGLIQAANQTRLAESEYLRRQKADAYVKYYGGIALLAHASSDNDTKEALSSIAEARARIAMYGSRDVVIKMAAVFRHGPIRRKDMRGHASLINAMRFDASKLSGDLPAEDAFELLYGRSEDY